MYLVASLTSQRDGLKAKLASLRQLVERMPALKAEFQQLQSGTVETRETAILQRSGSISTAIHSTTLRPTRRRLSDCRPKLRTRSRLGGLWWALPTGPSMVQ